MIKIHTYVVETVLRIVWLLFDTIHFFFFKHFSDFFFHPGGICAILRKKPPEAVDGGVSMYRITWTDGQGDRTDAEAVRIRVFVEEQGYAREDDLVPAEDDISLHLTVYDGGLPGRSPS